MRALFATLTCAAAMIAGGWRYASAAPSKSLCGPEETIVFSCPTGTHIASVCASNASKKVSTRKAHLQYRFGRNDKIELAYPDADSRPDEVFSFGTLIFSGGGGTWLRFSKNEFTYTIFSALGKWGRSGAKAEAAGVAVQKGGQEFANFPCRTPPIGELGPDLLTKIGIKPNNSPDEFQIPQAFFPK